MITPTTELFILICGKQTHTKVEIFHYSYHTKPVFMTANKNTEIMQKVSAGNSVIKMLLIFRAP